MTLHAPQSKAQVISLLIRRTFSSRKTLMILGAGVAASVVLAGRGPNVSAAPTEFPDISIGSLAISHLGLPDGNTHVSEKNTWISAAILPDSLKLPTRPDRPIHASLYNVDSSLPETTEPVIAAPKLLDSTIFPGTEKESIALPKVRAVEDVRVASLSIPEDGLDNSVQDFSWRLPDFLPAPVEPSLDDVRAIDVAPEIESGETGPTIKTLEARSGEIIEQMLARVNLRDDDRLATLVALRADDVSQSLSEGDLIDIAVKSASDNRLVAIRLRQVGKPPVELRWDSDTVPLWASVEPQTEVIETTAIPTELPKPKTLSVTGRDDDTIFISGEITSSLYAAAGKAGLTAGETKSLTDIFRYSVDFGRDLRKGDRFEALFEKGENGSYGDILYAKLTNRGSEIVLYRGTDNETGQAGYFDATGKTNKRTLMRTPLASARVSSHFGMRMHPVLGYTKMHRGTDFRARKGTPIFAAGDGIVEFLGRNGAYGKYIRIRHNSAFETAYAHMSGYANNLSSGMRVRQGEVIGYVGSTGRSTGPHLHFEILEHGNQVNPLKIADFGPVKGLSGSDLSRFKVRVSRIEIALTLQRNGARVATAE